MGVKVHTWRTVGDMNLSVHSYRMQCSTTLAPGLATPVQLATSLASCNWSSVPLLPSCALYMECAKMHFYSSFHGYLITAGILDKQVCWSDQKISASCGCCSSADYLGHAKWWCFCTHEKPAGWCVCCDQTNWILDSLLVSFVEKWGKQKSVAVASKALWTGGKWSVWSCAGPETNSLKANGLRLHSAAV